MDYITVSYSYHVYRENGNKPHMYGDGIAEIEDVDNWSKAKDSLREHLITQVLGENNADKFTLHFIEFNALPNLQWNK